MPIHDWTRVDAGLFHAFHQDWTIELARTLNRGLLPSGFSALPDQVTGGGEPDVLALQRASPVRNRPDRSGGVALAEAPPEAQFVEELEEEDIYARKANRVKIAHRHGRVVAVVEVVSPGNKSSKHGIAAFLRKTTDLLAQGVNLLVVDLFPPTPRDPHGIHRAIWGEWTDSTFEPPADKPLTAAAYRARPTKAAYIEPLAVGDDLPEHLPIFLTDDIYVRAPLETTYRASWAAFPPDFQDLLEPPAA